MHINFGKNGSKNVLYSFALKLTGCFALQRDETRVVLPLTESRLLGTRENKCKNLFFVISHTSYLQIDHIVACSYDVFQAYAPVEKE